MNASRSIRTPAIVWIACVVFYAAATGVNATTINVDIPVRPITGTFTFNGEPAPTTPYENARVYLRNPRTGDEVLLGQTKNGSYLSNLIPGDYGIYYERIAGGDQVPKNGKAYIGDVTIEPPSEIMTVHNINIPYVSVSGTISLNGAPPPASAYENGRILAVDVRTQDEILLGTTKSGGFSDVLLVPGQYDIYYDRWLGGNFVPRNERALLQRIRLNVPTNLGQIQVPVPEPSSYALALLSVLGLGLIYKMRRNADDRRRQGRASE